MAANLRVLNLAFVEERYKKRPGDVQNIRRLLGRKHLTDRNERHSVAAADMSEQFHQQTGQRRRKRNLKGGFGFFIHHAQLRVASGLRSEYFTKVIGGSLIAWRRQSAAKLLGASWHGHCGSPISQ